MFWYRLGQVLGVVFTLVIYTYLIVDMIHNIKTHQSVTPNIAAFFAIAAWQNMVRLSHKCQKNKLEEF